MAESNWHRFAVLLFLLIGAIFLTHFVWIAWLDDVATSGERTSAISGVVLVSQNAMLKRSTAADITITLTLCLVVYYIMNKVQGVAEPTDFY